MFKLCTITEGSEVHKKEAVKQQILHYLHQKVKRKTKPQTELVSSQENIILR